MFALERQMVYPALNPAKAQAFGLFFAPRGGNEEPGLSPEEHVRNYYERHR
jgi:hypothetical protein